jgi:hypothetical protein
MNRLPFEADFDGALVGDQPFGLGDRLDGFADGRQARG